MKRRNLAGQQIGKYSVLAHVGTNSKGETKWKVRCNCGVEKVVDRQAFRKGAVRGCGRCDPHPTNFEDLKGTKSGRLVALDYVGYITGHHVSKWRCRCECGAIVIVASARLKPGSKQTLSCGCLRSELLSVRQRTHGQSQKPLYAVWNGMRSRCGNPNNAAYQRYGARGIRVCDKWASSFEAFAADVGEPPTPQHQLDRFPNNDGHYEPGNIRWALSKANNRNKTNNRVIEFNGERKCITEWAESIGMQMFTLRNRLASGWSIEKALTTPVRECRRRSR